jgi:hypothetical protein
MKKPYIFLILILAFVFGQVGLVIAHNDIIEDDNVAQVQQTEPQLQQDTELVIEAKDKPVLLKAKAYTRKQTENMKLAYEVGEELGHGHTMQAILLQETIAGEGHTIGNQASPVGKRSYGLMQVQVVAARSVLQRYPEVYQKYFGDRPYRKVMDEEIIALLLTNKEASMRIATYNFDLMMKLTKGSWHRAVAAYNAGIGNALQMKEPSKFGYVRDVALKVHNVVKPFNKEIGL